MSSNIHPLAAVMPGAVIGEGCEIGPFAYVGPQVKLGPGCRLHPHAMVDGRTTLGSTCEIFPFASIGGKTQDLKWQEGYTAFVEIGDRCTFREYVTVHASTSDGGKTVIGSDCSLLAYCHIAHDCNLGDRVVMSNLTQLAGHVEVGNHVTFGGMVAVIQFVRIGSWCMVGATSKVVQDLAPFMLNDGSPCEPRMPNKIGLERHGFTPETVRALFDIHKLYYRSNLRAEEAVAKIRAEYPELPEAEQFIAFTLASKKGVARPKAG